MAPPAKQKLLILAVENTAAMEPYWETILNGYIFEILVCLERDSSASNFEFALVLYNAQGCHFNGRASDLHEFYLGLSAIPFPVSGAGVDDVAAIAEGLDAALKMTFGANQHCILVAASDSHPCAPDAETVAKLFHQFSVSLSVICPKQLAIGRAIYNAGMRGDDRSADPPSSDAKDGDFLVLISDSFGEARTAFSLSGPAVHQDGETEPYVNLAAQANVNIGNNFSPAPMAMIDPNPGMPQQQVLANNSATEMPLSQQTSSQAPPIFVANGSDASNLAAQANMDVLNNFSQQQVLVNNSATVMPLPQQTSSQAPPISVANGSNESNLAAQANMNIMNNFSQAPMTMFFPSDMVKPRRRRQLSSQQKKEQQQIQIKTEQQLLPRLQQQLSQLQQQILQFEQLYHQQQLAKQLRQQMVGAGMGQVSSQEGATNIGGGGFINRDPML